MPSDRRWVLIPVDDPRVTDLSVEQLYISEDGGTEDFIDSDLVPVPPDDQLAKAIDRVTRRTMRHTYEGLTDSDDADFHAAEHLRAAFQLGEEE